MDFVSIGTIIKKHGLDGTIEVLSDFEYPELVFKEGITIYIDMKPYKVISSSKHNEYYMLKLEGINTIDKALLIMHKDIYIKRDIIDDKTLRTDLIGMEVYSDKYLGQVSEILINKKYDILRLDSGILVPNIPEYIIRIQDNKIYIRWLDEN